MSINYIMYDKALKPNVSVFKPSHPHCIYISANTVKLKVFI